MGTEKVAAQPVRVSPDSVASWIGAEITIAELDATTAMARGDEQAALGMLARAGGLGDAHALITGACRSCGQHVGQQHRGTQCRSGGGMVGARTDADPTYCADVAPARTFGSFTAMVEATGGSMEPQVWTPGAER